MMNTDMPRFVHDLLASCPAAGGGVNLWLYRCARVLHAYRSEAEIKKLLAASSANCGRPVTDDEISRAVTRSLACAYDPARQKTVAGNIGKWPAPELGLIEKIVFRHPKLTDLWERSPVQLLDNNGRTEEIIDILFPGNPLLCVGKSVRDCDTLSREEWRGRLHTMPFIVPSPMSTRMGITQEGKLSKRALANTGPRRFLVVECDFSVYARDGKTPTIFAPLIKKLEADKINTLDMGASVLAHLALRAPLALAVHSGGKSLHGWFYCVGQGDSRLEKFMRYAVSIGADPATWTRSQLVRIPDGQREDGKRQVTYYFNPEVVK